jgi:hypothetical protein
MVSFNPSATKIVDVKVYGWAVYENLYPVDQNDTITCSDFVTTVALDQAFLVNSATGVEITCTAALNVVTVTGAAVDVECTLFVFGRRV